MVNGILFCELINSDSIWVNASIEPISGKKYMNVNGKLEVEED